MEGAKHYESNARADAKLRSGVVVVNSPMVHLGGLFRIVQAVGDGRRFVLLERFQVEPWIDAVRRHRPATVSLVPAALRMVYDADLDPADLASVRSVVSGTAPLDPALAEAFTETLRRARAHLVRGDRVRRRRGRVEPEGPRALRAGEARERRAGPRGVRAAGRRRGSPARSCPFGAVGLLEVRTAQVDPDRWIRTTDLARMDADGFLWIEGRADQTILRGGFKVQPETVRRALLRHPARDRRRGRRRPRRPARPGAGRRRAARDRRHRRPGRR